MLYERILENPKLASYPQSRVLLLPGGAFGALTGSAIASVRSYESRLRIALGGGRAGLSAAPAPALTVAASPRKAIDKTKRQDRFHAARPAPREQLRIIRIPPQGLEECPPETRSAGTSKKFLPQIEEFLPQICSDQTRCR